MKIKKIVLFTILLTFTGTFITGCSQTNSASSSDDASLDTITIAARDGSYSDVINAVIGDFEKEKNCRVEVISLSADEIHDNVIAAKDNEEPLYDVIMIDDPLMPEYIEKDILCNLTRLGYADDSDFVEKSALLGKDPYPLGATYALPFSGNVQLIFYNKKVIGENADLTSWEGIYDACSSAKEAGYDGYALRGQSGNPIVSDFLPVLWAFGGDVFDSNNKVAIDSQESRDALEFYCRLHETGSVYDKSGLVEAVNGGAAGLCLGWPSWFTTNSDTDVSIAIIPGKASPSSAAYTTGEIGNWLLGVTSNSKNTNLSLKLCVYLTSESVQRSALDYGGVPTRKSIFRDSEVLAKYPYFEYIYSGTNNSRVRPRTSKWSRIEDVFGEQLVKCINGEQTVEETITNSQSAIEALALE